MDKIKIEFLSKCVLGRKTEFNNEENLKDACISHAYKDMMSAGRFRGIDNKEKITGALKEVLAKKNYSFSRDMIEKVSRAFSEDENAPDYFGLAQKLVNMTFKYFYVFDVIKKADYTNCDCPIDSNVLDSIGKSNMSWSKLSKEEYENIQNEISKRLNEDNCKEVYQIGNMIYDFMVWGRCGERKTGLNVI